MNQSTLHDVSPASPPGTCRSSRLTPAAPFMPVAQRPPVVMSRGPKGSDPNSFDARQVSQNLAGNIQRPTP